MQIMQKNYVHVNKVSFFGCFNITEHNITPLGTKDVCQTYALEWDLTWKVLWRGVHAACPALVWWNNLAAMRLNIK